MSQITKLAVSLVVIFILNFAIGFFCASSLFFIPIISLVVSIILFSKLIDQFPNISETRVGKICILAIFVTLFLVTSSVGGVFIRELFHLRSCSI